VRQKVDAYTYKVIDALPNSDVLYGEVMRLAKLGMTLVGTSVMDERAFSTMTFVNNCLRAILTTHLPLCARMKVQEEYDLETFPYSALSVRACCWPCIAC
jgi:hypothetical protein